MASRIFAFAPNVFRTRTLEAALMEALAAPLEDIALFGDRLPVYLTPEGMPAAWLGWFGRLLGLPTDLDLSEYRQRMLIRVAVWTWVHKGPIPTIQAYVRAATGITAEVETVGIVPFLAGVSKAGDVCGIDNAWEFIVTVPTGSITEAELRRILTPVVPVFCPYTVAFS